MFELDIGSVMLCLLLVILGLIQLVNASTKFITVKKFRNWFACLFCEDCNILFVKLCVVSESTVSV